MTRPFDPVLSAALGTELARRADAARPVRRAAAAGHRWQLAVTAVVLVLVVLGSVAVLRGAGPRSAPAAPALPSRLAFPEPAASAGPVVGRARGGAGRVSGRLSAPVAALSIVIRCQGSGRLSISTSDGTTSSWLPVTGATRSVPLGDQAACVPGAPHTGSITVDADGGLTRYGRLRYTVVPEGRVVWSIAFVGLSAP